MTSICARCEEQPRRRLPDPIPPDTLLSWVEQQTGYPLYCERCLTLLPCGNPQHR